MSTRMLIDARHSEETRVAIVKGNRIEDFDYESSAKKQLKGNIYLARVTRVEPSLQAAFVEYGGNRHGFLAFSEIHPDYYQIPTEDLEEIKAEEEALAKSDQERAEREEAEAAEHKDAQVSSDPVSEDKDQTDDDEDSTEDNGDSNIEEIVEESDELIEDDDADEDAVEEDSPEEIEEAASARRRYRALKRRYKIQEVIKRRQVLLIQVVKEERGNKGAALTTYMSLAGRYCVLMPNSTHSGGISRKISSQADRKRLKSMISSLRVPNEMGLIVRTAGMKRTKAEVKRDYDYLVRLWDGIRELTLRSSAPTCVYEEGSLIKRAIRDLYSREIDEILVEGDGYRIAKDFMKMLMPSHSKKVQHYRDRIPLFHRYQVEGHMASMYEPIVQLKSGGYIVINPTEALISIDVNSGRATKEKNIEETAVNTNLEAAEEVARQLRLRDMAGLVVIDFIDMEHRNNNRAVERRMKDSLKTDRARIQVGRISSFGLMEMSRQRLRPNLLEASMTECPHCKGSGVVRTIESAALMALRELEEEGIRARSSLVKMALNSDVAIYLLNKKRDQLLELESRYHYVIEVASRSDLGPSDMEVTREAGDLNEIADKQNSVVAITPDSMLEEIENDEKAEAASEAEAEVNNHQETATSEENADDKPRKKRRRRRRRRRPNDDEVTATNSEGSSDDQPNKEASEEESTETKADSDDNGEEGTQRTRRRRGRRGGRRRRGADRTNNDTDSTEQAGTTDTAEQAAEDSAAPSSSEGEASDQTEKSEKPRRPRRSRARKPKSEDTTDEKVNTESTSSETSSGEQASDSKEKSEQKEDVKPKPRRRSRAKKKDTSESSDTKEAPTATDDKSETPEKSVEEKPKRRGRPRKVKPTEDSSTTEAVKATPKAEPKAEAKPEPKAEVKSEPKSEPKPEPKAEAKQDDNAPKKKGWWQKTFG